MSTSEIRTASDQKTFFIFYINRYLAMYSAVWNWEFDMLVVQTLQKIKIIVVLVV